MVKIFRFIDIFIEDTGPQSSILKTKLFLHRLHDVIITSVISPERTDIIYKIIMNYLDIHRIILNNK